MQSMVEVRRIRSHAARSVTSSGDFTAYVVRMRDADGAELESHCFAALWSSLRRALRTELIRRGLWNRPPSFLGVVGYTRWTEHDSDDDALDELAADCFTFVFLERIQALTAQLRRKPAIEGLVFRSIRNFLFERQKRHDPIGYRVYGVLRDAVDALVVRGTIDLEPADAAITNRVWLRFNLAPVHRDPPSSDRVRTTIEAWSDDLLPDLIVARGRARHATIESLADRIEALPEKGVSRIRFRRLAEHLRQAVRSRWSALLRMSELVEGDDTSALGRLFAHAQPPQVAEEREGFTRLVAAVEAKVFALDIDPSGREYLERLWSFARAMATETTTWPAGCRYSRASVAKALSIPRNRMPALCAQLEHLVEDSRSGS